ncbi:MAG: BLUF domain-containing protein [Myxococcales bacterium]|nr:BLUF domain-containing protein [Myxococcales bacterium]
MLVRLVYASQAIGEIDEAVVNDILECSRRNNPEHGVTGLLCTHPESGVFLQALEGGRTAVSRLYENLVRDPRHSDVTLLDFAEIEQRRFASWRMGIVDLDKVNRSSVLRFSEHLVLDPFSMSGARALGLLEELTSSAALLAGDA